MQKPITVARQELIDKICDIINKSGLPAFVVINILKNVLGELEVLEQQQLQRDLASWNEFCESQNQETPDDQ